LAVPVNELKSMLQYDQVAHFSEVFPTDLSLIWKKAKLLSPSVNDVVEPRSEQKPGKKPVWFEFDQFEDLAVIVEAPNGEDLDVEIYDKASSNLIGYGAKRESNREVILISNGLDRKEVVIIVKNFSDKPVNFGLKIFEINWFPK
jgi:hypothetical protein